MIHIENYYVPTYFNLLSLRTSGAAPGLRTVCRARAVFPLLQLLPALRALSPHLARQSTTHRRPIRTASRALRLQPILVDRFYGEQILSELPGVQTEQEQRVFLRLQPVKPRA